MMQFDRRHIERALPQKGFVRDRSGHHRYYYHESDGKRTGIYTYISHGSEYKTYGDSLLHSMRQQLRLDTVGQLANLVNCPMSRDDYNEHLEKKGLIPAQTTATRAASRRGKTRKTRKRGRRR